MKPTDQRALLRMLQTMLPLVAVLPLGLIVPLFNPLREPKPPLNGALATACYWIAESGGRRGVPLIAIPLIVLVVRRVDAAPSRQVREGLVIWLVLASFLGGAAYLNERVLKPAIGRPRPNIQELAETPPSDPLLRLSPAEFYELSSDERSRHLAMVLQDDIAQLPLSDRVRQHWIAQTGFSFPSGHAFTAIAVATFFLMLGHAGPVGRPRRLALGVLAAWAVAVCYSRLLLRVHTPLDITVGGLLGIALGVLAATVATRLNHSEEGAW